MSPAEAILLYTLGGVIIYAGFICVLYVLSANSLTACEPSERVST